MSITPTATIVPFQIAARGTGVAQDVEAGGHRFATDAYPAFGGADEAPSPLFYVLAALSSCNQVTAALVAKDLSIELGAWSFDVVGDLDTDVLVNGAEGNANFDKVTVRATVETDADEEQFARLVSETARRCPVTQLYQRSGVEFENDWTRTALPQRTR
jgi:putative redox protein